MGGLWGLWAFCPSCKALQPAGMGFGMCAACMKAAKEKAFAELAQAGEFTEKGWRAHEKEGA